MWHNRHFKRGVTKKRVKYSAETRFSTPAGIILTFAAIIMLFSGVIFFFGKKQIVY